MQLPSHDTKMCKTRPSIPAAVAPTGKVHGLTTAASIWVTAALGALCGLAAWKRLVVAVSGVRFLLLAGGSIERWCQKALGIVEKADPPDSR